MSGPAPKEVERKFLFAEGWEPTGTPAKIRQGYLTLNGVSAELTSHRNVTAVTVIRELPNRQQEEVVVPLPRDKWKELTAYTGYEQPDFLNISKGFEARVRVKHTAKGVVATFTMKSGNSIGGERVEIEAEMDPGVAMSIESRYSIGTLEKTRYTNPLIDKDGEPVTADGHPLTLEVDVYVGKLEALRVAEIEFPPGVDTALPIERLPFLGREVTQDKNFSNARLAVNGLGGLGIPKGTSGPELAL